MFIDSFSQADVFELMDWNYSMALYAGNILQEVAHRISHIAQHIPNGSDDSVMPKRPNKQGDQKHNCQFGNPSLPISRFGNTRFSAEDPLSEIRHGTPRGSFLFDKQTEDNEFRKKFKCGQFRDVGNR